MPYMPKKDVKCATMPSKWVFIFNFYSIHHRMLLPLQNLLDMLVLVQ